MDKKPKPQQNISINILGRSINLGTIAAIIILLVMAGVVIAAYPQIKTLKGSGIIKAVGIETFRDPDCTIPFTEIHYGWITLGDNIKTTFYIKNIGNEAANITIEISNYIPLLCEAQLIVTGELEMRLMLPNEVGYVNIYLTVNTEVFYLGDFSFNIVITAT